MKQKPKACKLCPAFSWGIGYVPASGPRNAKLAFIGQGPGKNEGLVGLPFIGPTGQLLRVDAKIAKIDPKTVYIDNVVRCWLPKGKTPEPWGNRTPTVKEIAYCWKTYGLPELIAVDPTCVVAVGVPSASTLLKIKAKSSMAGNVFEVNLGEQ